MRASRRITFAALSCVAASCIVLASMSDSGGASAAAISSPSTTTTIPDDYLTLYPSGVPDDYLDQIPSTGYGGDTIAGALAVLSLGAGTLALRRRLLAPTRSRWRSP